MLRDHYRNNFAMGAALSAQRVIAGDMSATLAKEQFNSITPEWDLKPNAMAPQEGVYDFYHADKIVDWALENGMQVRGHTLLWHAAAPEYFLKGTPNEIRARLEDYIHTVMDHFRGRIKVWDVVNEVVSADIYRGADGIGPDRRSNWYNAVGSADYIEWAFRAAREADPDALLFINEFDTETPLKRKWLIDILRRLKDKDVPIDGVGHQFHFFLDTDYNEALAAIDAVDNEYMGLINHATEIDTSFYHDPGSCWQSYTSCDVDLGPSAPEDLLAKQAHLLRNLLDELTYRPSVESVSFWGVRDGDSWLNTSPVERHNFPLLFDREGHAKPAFHALTDPNYAI